MSHVTATDQRELDLVFIHSAIDDLGLDPYEFRIYSRLVRRAGKRGVAYESVSNMAIGCRMGERKARLALRELEARGLVIRHERPGETTEYVITHQRHWKKPSPAPHAAPTPAPDAAPDPGTQCRPPRHHMPGTPAPGAAKGNPLKVIPLRNKPPVPPKAKTSKPRTRKPKTHEFNPETVELPAHFNRELFLDFCASRLEQKKPMTNLALKRFIELHTRHPAPVLDEMFRRAIASSWQGLYALKPDELEALNRTTSTSTESGGHLDQYKELGL